MRKLVLSVFIIVVTIFTAHSLFSGNEEKHYSLSEVNYNPPIILNETLTNQISSIDDLSRMDRDIRRYLSKWCINGASLSIMRNDSLVYSKGYGWADKEKNIKMQPNHILRVASVSKLITATGIMILQEKGLLSLRDTVFGPKGILCDSIYTKSIRDKNYYKITVEDLLRHKGGFSKRYGDPMFTTRSIMLRNHLETPPDHETLVQIQLKQRLRFRPGTSQSYSNFGYLLLSMIIEKVSGVTYEDFIQANVLVPAGCYDMHIANNYYDERYDNEVKYYVQSNDAPVLEYNNSGKMCTRCYGGNDIHALAGAGAWVCSTAELARFVASIDGKEEIPDIISKESVEQMTEWFDKETYSLGWNDTKPTGEWTRTGTLSGTSALIKYFPDGECWIFTSNTSTWKGPGLARYTSSLFRKLRTKYSEKLPTRDLFTDKELYGSYYDCLYDVNDVFETINNPENMLIPKIWNSLDSLEQKASSDKLYYIKNKVN